MTTKTGPYLTQVDPNSHPSKRRDIQMTDCLTDAGKVATAYTPQ